MKIAILGTGIVGATLGRRLTRGGHEVRMGSRTAGNPRAVEWVESIGPNASEGTFADAAAFGEVALNCTAGMASLQALESAGRENLRGKILIDLSNPLDFSKGMPPSLTVCNTDSLGEMIQRALPEVKVVKTLNTLNCQIMAHPELVPGDHNVFVSGNDPEARGQVAEWLESWFGWPERNIIDLGDITTARGTEMILPLWIRLIGALGTATFNWHVVVGEKP